MNRHTIIIVSGKKQSGKDTFCSFVNEFAPSIFSKLAFADSLKISLQKFLKFNFDISVPLDSFYLNEKKEKKLSNYSKISSLRVAMQWFGQMMKENFGEDFWVKKVISQIELHPGNCVISDARFPYEIEGIKNAFLNKEYNIYSIRINRKSSLVDSDISETALDEKPITYFDFTIDNNGTFDEFEESCRKILTEIFN